MQHHPNLEPIRMRNRLAPAPAQTVGAGGSCFHV